MSAAYAFGESDIAIDGQKTAEKVAY